MPNPAHRVYLAAPLFTLNERHANRRLASAIMSRMPNVEVFLPQDIKYHSKFNDRRFFAEVYQSCLAHLKASSACIALLDGPSADDGTCFEIGYAIASSIPVLGIRTDYRQSQEMGCNLMLSRGCTAFIHRPCFDENFDTLARDVARKLPRILNRNRAEPVKVAALKASA